MTRLNVALVGAGFMGALHARVVAESDAARLAAVIDIAPERAHALADAFATRAFADIDAARAAGSVDAWIVALPDRLHQEVVCHLLAAGSAVLVEKPMAHSLNAARTMAAAEAKGGRLLVGQILRFDPRYAEAAAAVREGRIGTPIHGASGRFTLRDIGQRMNGTSSVCFYLGVHDVDALQWISGRDVVSVQARAVSTMMPSLGVPSEDAIFATCEMTGGMVGQLYFGWTLPSSAPTGIWARTEVMGSEGFIDLDVRDHGLRVHSKGSWSLPDGLHWPAVNGRITGDLYEEVRHFITAVRDEEPFLVSVADAMRTVAVNDAILCSVASGAPQPVKDWRI